MFKKQWDFFFKKKKSGGGEGSLQLLFYVLEHLLSDISPTAPTMVSFYSLKLEASVGIDQC